MGRLKIENERVNDWIRRWKRRKVKIDEMGWESLIAASDDGSCDKLPLSQRLHFLPGS
jgi:hypothetical protein